MIAILFCTDECGLNHPDDMPYILVFIGLYLNDQTRELIKILSMCDVS